MLKLCTKLTLATTMSLATAVITLYIAKFKNHEISDNPEKWGQLGDYIGGILNPTFGFITILILLATMRLQREQLNESRKELELTRRELSITAAAATKQAAHLEREASLAEHIALIEKLATRTNKNFNEDRLDAGLSVHRFINSYKDPLDKITTQVVLQHYTDINSKTHKSIKWIESDLKRLAILIEHHEKISTQDHENINRQSPIPKFYQEEFGEIVDILFEYGMIEHSLKSFYCK